MFGLQLKTFDRDAITRLDDAGDPDAGAVARYLLGTYLGMRLAIGVVGLALPATLVLVDWLLMAADPRGSMSAYYHSSSRDVFVGGLVVTAAFLLTYMSARKRTYDYWLSSAAGVAVLVVALFPTGRDLKVEPTLDAGSRSCDLTAPGVPPCNALQERFGEDVVKLVHGAAAGSFVVLLVALCAVFALREFGYGPSAKQLCGEDRDVRCVYRAVRERGVGLWDYLLHGVSVPDDAHGGAGVQPPRRRAMAYAAFGALIVLGGAWALVGPDVSVPGVGTFGEVYVGEVLAFTAFAAAWLTASREWDVLHGVARTIRRGVLGGRSREADDSPRRAIPASRQPAEPSTRRRRTLQR